MVGPKIMFARSAIPRTVVSRGERHPARWPFAPRAPGRWPHVTGEGGPGSVLSRRAFGATGPTGAGASDLVPCETR